jgi:hypothetical protein
MLQKTLLVMILIITSITYTFASDKTKTKTKTKIPEPKLKISEKQFENLGHKEYKVRRNAIGEILKDINTVSKAKQLLYLYCIPKCKKTTDIEVKLNLHEIIYHCSYIMNFEKINAIADNSYSYNKETEIQKLLITEYYDILKTHKLGISLFSPGNIIENQKEESEDDYDNTCNNCGEALNGNFCKICD